MKRALLAVSVGFLLLFGLTSRAAPETNSAEILIVELLTGTSDSASHEFVELFNVTDEPIELTDWQLQYKSADGADWLTKSNLNGEIQPRGRYLVSTNGYHEDIRDAKLGSGLAQGGGHVRIVKVTTSGDAETVTEHDRLAWGSADNPEGDNAAAAAAKDESLKRRFDEDGVVIDTDDNGKDFFISLSPSPSSTDAPPRQPEPEIDESPEVDESGEPEGLAAPPGGYLPVTITELFPDPDSPLTDAEDEFVELFNPNETEVNLEGYVVETGSEYSYAFELPALSLQPGQYLALYSIDTSLTLSNSGGQARILAPNGTVLAETEPYPKAKAGLAWMLRDGVWDWTDAPTPGAANSGAVASATSESSSKKSSSSSRSRSGSGSDDDERVTYEEPDEMQQEQLNNTVLAGVGSLALLYAGYEYRHDIGNRFNQLKRYVRNRRSNR